MKLVSRKLLLALACLLPVQVAVAQAPQVTAFTADMQMTATGGPLGPRDMTGKMYVGAGHMRMNANSGGHETAMITTFATKTVDVLMPQQKMYMEHKAGDVPGRGSGSSTVDVKPVDPNHPCENMPDVTCKKIGAETVGGRTCDHWELTDKQGKVTNFWIDQKLRFPIKIVAEDSTMTLTNIQEGEPDASLFQIPADFHKIDMGGMMPQGMGGPPH
jgi:Domain of unknown function (DUF4412)